MTSDPDDSGMDCAQGDHRHSPTLEQWRAGVSVRRIKYHAPYGGAVVSLEAGKALKEVQLGRAQYWRIGDE